MTDPRLLANLAALREAQDRIAEAVPAPTPEAEREAERAAMLAEQARLRRPTPDQAAKAWKARNKEFRRRASLTIAGPEEAIRVWLDGVRRRTGGDRPVDVGARSRRVGQTAEEQVVAKVRQTRALLAPEETLDAAIRAWPLPMTFYDDLTPLCGVETELLADPRRYEPEPEPEGLGEANAPSDDRLLRGMRRAPGDGLHG